jgi:hypothetical protein
VVLAFEGGALARREIVVGGKTRVWQHYERGALLRKERDTDGDGRPDYWEEWSAGALRRVAVDRNGDGEPDSWDSARAADEAR